MHPGAHRWKVQMCYMLGFLLPTASSIGSYTEIAGATVCLEHKSISSLINSKFNPCLMVVNVGLYELSQYAFLADRNGGEGLTWAKLHDPECGMITVWAILAAECILFMSNAWYLDQVCFSPHRNTGKENFYVRRRTWEVSDTSRCPARTL